MTRNGFGRGRAETTAPKHDDGSQRESFWPVTRLSNGGICYLFPSAAGFR